MGSTPSLFRHVNGASDGAFIDVLKRTIHESVAAVIRRLLIVLMNTDPRNPEELGAPFYYAAVAAAMDHTVDVLCTATAGKLMLKGIAAAIHVKPNDPMTVYDWIKEAHGQGAKFWACPANLELFGKTEADLIPECTGVMGAAAMIQDVMGDQCRVLTF